MREPWDHVCPFFAASVRRGLNAAASVRARTSGSRSWRTG